MFVLDTNSLLSFFKGEGQVGRRLLQTSPGEIGIPTLVLYGLATGIAKASDTAKRRRRLDTLLDVVTLLPFGAREARVAAGVRAKLEGEGTPIGPLDTLIAGVALANQGTLITRNTRAFGRVAGLIVENWYDGER